MLYSIHVCLVWKKKKNVKTSEKKQLDVTEKSEKAIKYHEYTLEYGIIHAHTYTIINNKTIQFLHIAMIIVVRGVRRYYLCCVVVFPSFDCV